jgi:hypothetical protein
LWVASTWFIRVARPLTLAACTLAVALAAVAGIGFAEPAAPAPDAPAGLEPLPDLAGDADLEPQVTIVRRKTEVVEEARVNGRLLWIKVTPLHGRPYYLIPDGGGYTYIRRDSLDSGLKVPLWVLLTF